jgi:hypothetical protein
MGANVRTLVGSIETSEEIRIEVSERKIVKAPIDATVIDIIERPTSPSEVWDIKSVE